MGYWFHVDFNIVFDRRADETAFLILLDRHLFSPITRNYKCEYAIETSLSKTKENLKIGLLKEPLELIDGFNVNLSCSGSLEKSSFENHLIYCINYIIEYNDLGKSISHLYLKINDSLWSGNYIYDKNFKHLRFIDDNDLSLSIINLND